MTYYIKAVIYDCLEALLSVFAQVSELIAFKFAVVNRKRSCN